MRKSNFKKFDSKQQAYTTISHNKLIKQFKIEILFYNDFHKTLRKVLKMRYYAHFSPKKDKYTLDPRQSSLSQQKEINFGQK